MNASLLTVLHVFPGSEDLICEESFGTVPGGSFVGFHRFLEGCSFVVGIPSQIPNSQEAINNTHLYLGTEFHICILFPSNDRPDPMLGDTHNPIRYLVGFRPVHVLLLGIHRPNHLEHLILPERKLFLLASGMLPLNEINDSKVSP